VETEVLLRFKSGGEMAQGGVLNTSSLSSSFLSGDFFLVDLEPIRVLHLAAFRARRRQPSSVIQLEGQN
jgi:hypothetical protein